MVRDGQESAVSIGELPLLAADDHRDALAVLAIAPSPAMGRGLSRSKLESALRRHGRQRNVPKRAEEIETLLRAPLYRRLRHRGQTHNMATRVIANRLVGMLHACLRDRTPYDEQRAWSRTIAQYAA